MDPQIDTILGPDLKPFETLISGLSNPITSDEQESLFNLCKQVGLNTVVEKFGNLLAHSPDIEARKMSAILFGNVFEKFEDIEVNVKDLLLECVVKEENRPIIEILGHTISKLKAHQSRKDVADTLFERFANDNTSVQESALLIFPQLIQFVYAYRVEYMIPLRDAFMNCLGNVGSANVRIAALIAATSFMQWLKIDGVSFQNLFQDLLPGMMHCLVEVLNGGDEAMKQKALLLLIKLAETKPSFFRGQLVDVVGSMLQIADTESLEEGTRNLAIKFVITLVESVINCNVVPYIIPLHGVFKSCLENVMASNVPFTLRLHIGFKNHREGLGSANVRIAALIAATSFIQCLVKYEELFQDLLPGMMQCLVEVLNGGDEAMKQKALVLLIKLAETKPSFFTERLVEVVWSMLQIAEAESLDDRTRDLAIEFVIMLEVSNRGPAHIHVRAMSAFLLGNLFKQCHPMSESTQLRVNVYLRACVLNEENKPIIEILGYSISMLAPDKDFANPLLDDVANLQESALLIFPHVVQYLIASKKTSNVQMASNVPFESRLRHVFKTRLGELGSANERIAALIAATSFIQCVKSSSDGDWFQGLLMQCLNEVLNGGGGDEAMTQKALFLLIELAETDASFFNRQLEVVVGSMSQIANAVILDEETRLLAKKFLITLNEAHAVSAVVNISDNFPPDTSMPDMLEIVGNLRQFRRQEGIASDQTRTLAIEKLLKQFREKLPPTTWASRWSSLRLKSILARKEN